MHRRARLPLATTALLCAVLGIRGLAGQLSAYATTPAIAVPTVDGRIVVFGDITTAHVWYADMAEVLRAGDGVPTTLAPIHELDAGLRRLAEETFRAHGSRSASLPGAAAVSGRGRVDMRFAEDNEGELYVLTKSDGMIRQVVGLK